MITQTIPITEEVQDIENPYREALRFENEPFKGFLRDENGDVYVNQGWRNDSLVRALNIQVEDFGSVSEFLGINIDPNTSENLTEEQRKLIQWGVFHLNHPSSDIETPMQQHLSMLEEWEASMLEETKGNINPTLLRNLALLNDLRVVNLTIEELKALSKVDITNIDLNEVFEIAIAQPGYWGRYAESKAKKVDQKLGQGNWYTMFNFNGKLIGHSKFAIDFFENAYRYYFGSSRKNYDELNYLSENASNMYEHPDQIDLDFAQGYDPTSYYGRQTTFQFVLLKRIMLYQGLQCEGKEPIMIRGTSVEDTRAGDKARPGGPIGRTLHPGAIAVPLEIQNMIPAEQRSFGRSWWAGWEEDQTIFNSDRFNNLYGNQQENPFSVEKGYHRCKSITVRRNPNEPLVQEFLAKAHQS